jgi:hypothetical protein
VSVLGVVANSDDLDTRVRVGCLHRRAMAALASIPLQTVNWARTVPACGAAMYHGANCGSEGER